MKSMADDERAQVLLEGRDLDDPVTAQRERAALAAEEWRGLFARFDDQPSTINHQRVR